MHVTGCTVLGALRQPTQKGQYQRIKGTVQREGRGN